MGRNTVEDVQTRRHLLTPGPDALPDVRLIPKEDVTTDPAFRRALLGETDGTSIPALTMFDGVAIVLYLLDRYDADGRLGPVNDYAFRSKLYQYALYCSGTLDELSANSSPIQRTVLKETGQETPGADPGTLNLKALAFKEVSGPMLEQEFEGKRYAYGDSFSALDIIFGYIFHTYQERRKFDWLDDFPNLKAYLAMLMQEKASVLATIYQ